MSGEAPNKMSRGDASVRGRPDHRGGRGGPAIRGGSGPSSAGSGGSSFSRWSKPTRCDQRSVVCYSLHDTVWFGGSGTITDDSLSGGVWQ